MKFKNYQEALAYEYDETYYQRKPFLFLAGGITGCPDWQAQVTEALLDPTEEHGTILNPRQKDFPIEDPNAARDQIEWEYRNLAAADLILFWFPEEQIQPIALFELGRWSAPRTSTPIVVGAHPNYPRRQDIEIQLELARPGLEVHRTLEETIHAVIDI